MSAITFKGVSRDFGEKTPVHNIDLDVLEGARIAIMGPNGAGKTTLLRLGAGLLNPTAGSVERHGLPMRDPAARQGIAHVDQDAAIYPELTAREHLRWWADTHGRPLDIDHWLEDAGLTAIASEQASHMSRGQRQRLRLAMAFALEPELLLLDEPTTGLDEAGVRWLTTRLGASRAALLIATHERGLVQDIGASVRLMTEGRLV